MFLLQLRILKPIFYALISIHWHCYILIRCIALLNTNTIFFCALFHQFHHGSHVQYLPHYILFRFLSFVVWLFHFIIFKKFNFLFLVFFLPICTSIQIFMLVKKIKVRCNWQLINIPMKCLLCYFCVFSYIFV